MGGPLAPYADEFRLVLADRGYAPSSAEGQLQLMAHLSRWLSDRGLDGHGLIPAVVEQFLQARRAAGCREWYLPRGMTPLLDHLRAVGIAPVPAAAPAAGRAEMLLAAYRAYLVEERGLAASTVRNYLDVAWPFVATHCSATAGLADLTAAQVSDFVLAECHTRRGGSLAALVIGMRTLLRYLHLAGITPTGLAGAVPPAACWATSVLPHGRSPAGGAAAALL